MPDWLDTYGPAPDIQPRFVSVDILDSIAVVRLEVDGWSGALTGAKLLDFGLAKYKRPVPIDDVTRTIALTDSVHVVGTLPYMSPEQLEGKEAGHGTISFWRWRYRFSPAIWPQRRSSSS